MNERPFLEGSLALLHNHPYAPPWTFIRTPQQTSMRSPYDPELQTRRKEGLGLGLASAPLSGTCRGLRLPKPRDSKKPGLRSVSSNYQEWLTLYYISCTQGQLSREECDNGQSMLSEIYVKDLVCAVSLMIPQRVLQEIPW